jgi:predicted RecB family nuclease
VNARRDLSKLKPQGAYVAKRCPMRVQLDVLQPTTPLPVSPELQQRFDDGNRFEAEVVARLRDVAAEDWVFVDEEDPAAQAQTLEAVDAGAAVIVGSHLPADDLGKRSGKPDLLVRHGDGYVPVDVKNHRTLEVRQGASARTSPLAAPTPDAAGDQADQALRRKKEDALQLAHYRRMLESAGRSAGRSLGGIIGTELVVTWYELDVPMWRTPAKSDGRKIKRRTTLENYDFEFGFRLDIAAAAHDHAGDPTRELLVVPVRCGDCPECPWRDYCDERLRAGSGDPSLLPHVGYRPWRALRDVGITDRTGVAALDFTTARLGADGVDLAKVLERSAGVETTTPMADLMKRAPKQLARLKERGIGTAGDALEQLDAATARLGGAGFLPEAILNARAALGAADVYRRPTSEVVAVSRGDLELDIDMESYDDLVYLWGVHVHDRSGTGLAEEGYLPFETWAPLDVAEEARLFARFWSWLSKLRQCADAGGHSLRCYVWSQAAENTKMRNASKGTELAPEVERLIASDQWVDLLEVFERGWTTGGANGLKEIAPLAGHRWGVTDPGGGQSMVRYARAVEGASTEGERDDARQWLRDYNRGDVEATLAIRRWLDEEGAGWPLLRSEGGWRGAGTG